MNKEKELELMMLGTGHAMVTRCYNTCFALRSGEAYLLVDAGGGNGILVQMEEMGLAIEQIHDMFVTHAHTDHILGVIWVIRKVATLMKKGSYDGNFTIYCHDKVKEFLQYMCMQLLPSKFTDFLGKRILLEEVKDGEHRTVADMQLTFFDIGSKKQKQFGFMALLPDGQKLTCLGDEPYQEKCREYAYGCDWLLSEAFCMDADKEIYKPYEKHHSTALDAGRIAQELEVKNLVLYHTEDDHILERKQLYTKEAQTYYRGNVFVPNDLERIPL